MCGHVRFSGAPVWGQWFGVHGFSDEDQILMDNLYFLTVMQQRNAVFRIGTVRYNWPMSAHASQAFSIAHCADSEDLPKKEISK